MELVSDNLGDVWFVSGVYLEFGGMPDKHSPPGIAQEPLSRLAWYVAFHHLHQDGI